MNREDWGRSWKPWLRGTAIGFPIGAMPAGGAEIGTFLSYSVERQLSKKPEEFGNGAIEGVAGPEAANNASAAGTLVPLLTLGLPTTATAAIMLAGFQQFGLQPGPLLFANNSQLVWGLIASLLVANFMLLVLNLPLIGLWVRLLTIPKPWLYAGILVFATLGTIGANPSAVRTVAILAGLRPSGLRPAPLRLSDRAGGGRADPRADGRAAIAPRPRDQPGRRHRSVPIMDIDRPVDAGHRSRGRADDHARTRQGRRAGATGRGRRLRSSLRG